MSPEHFKKGRDLIQTNFIFRHYGVHMCLSPPMCSLHQVYVERRPLVETLVKPIQTCVQRGVAILLRDMEHERVKDGHATDLSRAGWFQLDPALVFATSGKPSTWLPLGGLAEQAQNHV